MQKNQEDVQKTVNEIKNAKEALKEFSSLKHANHDASSNVCFRPQLKKFMSEEESKTAKYSES